MTDNILFSTGVVAYYRGSLEFSIIGDTLLLQSGAAYDDRGSLLTLEKTSYVVLENIALVFFENYKKYHFYLTQEETFHRLVSEQFLAHTKLEEGIYFFITTQQYDECILLGEIEIDYDEGNAQGKHSIGIPNNAFYPGKNEINLKSISRYTVLPSPVTQMQRSTMSQTLLGVAKVLHDKMVEENNLALSTLCSAFFQFADDVKSQAYAPYTLYGKFESHSMLFSWLDSMEWGSDIMDNVQELEALFTTSTNAYKTTFYHLNIEESESFFFQILHVLEALTMALKNTKVSLQNTHDDYPKEEILVSDAISEEFDAHFDTPPPENITIVEESTDEDESATVLLGGDRETYVQVGRGSQSGNDIIIGENDKTVSRIHLKITAHKQGFFLEDLSSMGTYVNGERIEKNVKKFVTAKHSIGLGKKGCTLDLMHHKIQILLDK
jgi:hypothetical protein